jgi:hypothetical protein
MARSFVKQAGGSIRQNYFNYLLWCVEVLRKLNKIEANLPSDKPAPSAEAGVGAPASGGSSAAGPGTGPDLLAQLAALQAEVAKQRVELAATKEKADGAENAASAAVKKAGQAHALSKKALTTSRKVAVMAVSAGALAFVIPKDMTPEKKAAIEAAKATATIAYGSMFENGVFGKMLGGRSVGALTDASPDEEEEDD